MAKYRVQPFYVSEKDQGYRVRRGHGWKGHVAKEFQRRDYASQDELRTAANRECDELNGRHNHDYRD